MPIEREILNMLELGRKISQVIFSCLFRSKIAKIAKDKCPHCAMDLDYGYRRPYRKESSLCGYTPLHDGMGARPSCLWFRAVA